MTKTSARDRLEQALSRIADPAGEGARACLTVYADEAREAADAADDRMRVGRPLGPLDGAIVSIKDLFDVAGEVTRAGSRILAEEGKPATADAAAIQRLRRAGAVIVAKTNMSEFAFHGIGTNPHFGTPANPADRARVPGGSTSGGAVAVADGMCEITIGSDTGGSTRAPASFCGIVGWKPSCGRIPTDGAFPLSFSLDAVGPMARTVAECADADAVLAGLEPRPNEAAPLAGLRFAVLLGLPLDGLDTTVSTSFQASLERLRRAGVQVTEHRLGLLDDMVRLTTTLGGVVPPEALAIHRERLSRRAGDIDPQVLARIERGRSMSAADYVELMQGRGRLVAAFDRWLEDYDAVVMPTTPTVAPLIEEVASPEVFGTMNMLTLRNTAALNFFDVCAVSLPMPETGALPAGLMLGARKGHDRRLLQIAAAVERLFAG